ncbi:DNA polymerase epsilon subunit 4 [Anas platyrhynchos]|uniref:DNA polymerase epsilon subunit 4 n=1 Tax=Anas platyrhynchos TaxID=8839 RepID=R0L6Q5_ANAPL|nr:DNA polymerase epsilon subunit 4 [Anas platyrhynchos]
MVVNGGGPQGHPVEETLEGGIPLNGGSMVGGPVPNPLGANKELFVETIAKDAYVYAQQGKRKTLQRKDLDNAIEAIDEFAFLEGSRCEPARIHMERLLLLEGDREVEVVGGCHCSAWPEECLRLPALKTFFPDSPWEVTVDVGRCSEPTYGAGSLFCMPTKFSTALVKNPSGGKVIRTLESCEMKEKCYRVSQVEYYYEIVHSSTGHREKRLKEIDVGRCLGSCSSGDPCLLRESQGGEKCLAWAEVASRRCAPHRYDVHIFRSHRDRIRTVVAIQQCKCRG